LIGWTDIEAELLCAVDEQVSSQHAFCEFRASNDLSKKHLYETQDDLARLFGVIAVRAGVEILRMRATANSPQYKSDGSPVTEADIAADEIIRRDLGQIVPDVLVITEETCTSEAVVGADRFILVDPLDGTKEFVRGSDEFTVNIALIDRGKPVAGAVYAPALRRLYVGGATAHRLVVPSHSTEPNLDEMRPIRVCEPPAAGWRAVVSRSHLDPATKQWIECHRVAELKPSGSSLKFCAVAEGEADVYPRLGPTMEWDTAAGHAVLLAAGGRVTDLNGQIMSYGKQQYRNGNFVAWGMAAAS
jgi:3'(2'), 5'-bisphosphate nucleotidase